MSEVLEKETTLLKGGEFLVKETSSEKVFTPEDLTEEQGMFGAMTTDFIKAKIHPILDRIDKQEEGLMESLLNEAGELGLLGATLPEEYGGMGIKITSETLLSERLGESHSFGVAVAAHTGIGTLPILYFGTEEQKKEYLPKLATGESKAAYCLTEPGSGSDALSAKTKATLTEDGEHYIIEGQKMWITNSGFADLFIVFAQIGGDKFTGFIVPAGLENINLGAEEDKMGIKGSSTRQVFFEGVKVPKENILGDIGKGHKIAFNVLNIGRYKLCAMVMGGARAAAHYATQYANERIQFKVPISSFGAIKHKLAQMSTLYFATESATYRVAGMIQDMVDKLSAEGMPKHEAKLMAAEEYAPECALLKVLGSETLDYCVDEAVQVYGGTGFSEEYPVARAYRDARINRIFEGTNEINRLLSVGMILKRSMKGQIDIMGPAMKITGELMSVPSLADSGDGAFAAEKAAIEQSKKAILMVSGSAAQKFMNKIEEQQEVLMAISDMAILCFASESVLLRVEKLMANKGEEACAREIDLAKVYISDALEQMNLHGKHAIASFAEGDELRMMTMGLKRFTKLKTFDTIGARRRVADAMIEANGYCF